MTPERWARVKEVVGAALEKPEVERRAFLDQACGEESWLRAEANRLLAQAAESLESPLTALKAPELQPGQMLGRYRVEAKLGQGGMGAVYKAWDEQLRRAVALKVLSSAGAGDGAGRQQLLREARAASRLNHPNIVTIHEVASDGTVDFIAMEYVEGQRLDRVIPEFGLPADTVVRYGTQVAAALAEAHEAGLIHRDLKPSNVMVAGDGLIKLLDFGVARTVAASTSGGTLTLGTLAGVLIGTPAYMSPEQAESKPLDTRSDIFSFGSLLYEMASGHRSFEGPSIVAVLAAVVRDQPRPPREIAPGISSELEGIILRCLEKDPNHRWQRMSDLPPLLMACLRTPGTPAPRWRRRILAAALTAAAVTAGGLLWRNLRPNLPSPALVPLTTLPGYEQSPSFSPDGRQVAFAWDGGEGNHSSIFAQMVGETGVHRLTADSAADDNPAWSPDGQRIAFVRRGAGDGDGIYLVSPLGGPEQRLTNYAPFGSIAWSPDGNYLAAVRTANQESDVILIPLSGGASRRLATARKPVSVRAPAFSPGGDRLAWVQCPEAYTCDLLTLDLDHGYTARGFPRQFAREEKSVYSMAWDREGDSLVFGAFDGRFYLWRADASGKRRSVRIELPGPRARQPAISPAGNRLAFASDQRNIDVWQYTAGGAARPLLRSSVISNSPCFSPDGTRVAFSSDRGGDRLEIWTANADGSNPAPLTRGVGLHQGSPDWSPDGKWIAFDSLGRDGRRVVRVVEATGLNLRRLTAEPAGEESTPVWSRDGKWIYFRSDRSGRNEIWRAPFGGGRADQITKERGGMAMESADGKTLYYTKDNSSPLFALSLADRRERKVLEFVHARAFAVADEGVYFIGRPGEDQYFPLLFHQFSTATERQIARLERVSEYRLTVSPDRRRFLYSHSVVTGTDLMLVENFH